MAALSAVVFLVVMGGRWWGATPAAAAAEPPRPAAAEEVAPAFPVLDEIERREKEAERRKAEQKRQQQLEDVQRLIQVSSLKSTADEQILFLLRAERLLTEMGQGKEDSRAAGLEKEVRRQLLAVPPPRVFRDASGVEMYLVEGRGDPFYLSRSPVSRGLFAGYVGEKGVPLSELPKAELRLDPDKGVVVAERPEAPVTAVSWPDLNGFCSWLSSKSAGEYRLPSVEQLRLARPKCALALWTSSEWQGPDAAAFRMRSRFSVRMYTVWDPASCLAKEEAVGELPFARYGSLGFLVATGLNTGIESRLRRLRSEL